MPTISQLPSVTLVSAADVVPLSQDGTACSVSLGTLLSGTQPAIIVPSNSLLGRVSIGSGGPEPITVGAGLELTSGNISANGGDHASFLIEQTFDPTDSLVMSSNGVPRLLPVVALRGLFSAGSNVSISTDGIVSATSLERPSESNYLARLPVAADVSAQDVVLIGQNGTDCVVTLGNLIGGDSIDTISSAVPASDTDMVLVAQGASPLSCQTLAAIWTWITSKMMVYQMPVVELASDTSLCTHDHNGRLIVCSKPLNLSANIEDLSSGFQCNVMNVSQGNIYLSDVFMTSSGGSTLPAGQSMMILSATYSLGNVLYASIALQSAYENVPGQVTNLVAIGVTSSSITLTWTAPTSSLSNLCYTVLSRQTGSAIWNNEAVGLPTNGLVISSLSSSTFYDIIVISTSSGVAGLPSNIISVETESSLCPVSAPTNLAGTNITSTSITITWSASSGSVQAYSVQYRQTGSVLWNNIVQALTSTSYTAAGLSVSQSYDWQVTATGSDGSTASSSVISLSTISMSETVDSIVWNSVPTGPLTHGSGALGVNAHVSPATASVRFGISNSITALPTTWVDGAVVNSDLWGAYIPTPTAVGTWYVCCEGIDGSSPTFYPTGIQIT